MADSIWVAYVGGFFGIAGALIAFLMNLSLRTRVSQHERDLAAVQSDLRSSEERLRSSLALGHASHEATLRVQAEVRLSLHEKSWSLLREMTVAIYECHRTLSAALRAVVLARQGGKLGDTKAAVDVVLRLEMIAASIPPEVDLEEMRLKFKKSLSEMQFTLPTDLPTFYDATAHALDDGIDAGKAAMEKWNAALWRQAPRIADWQERVDA